MKHVVILLASLVLVLGANLATGVPYPPAEPGIAGAVTGDLNFNTGGYQLIIDGGTQANPAIVFGDDDDGTGTGFATSGSNQFGVVINGGFRVYFTSGSVEFVNTLTASAGLIVDNTEADLAVGACTAGTFARDNATTRELCWCNDAGTAYDCISFTTNNGPTD